MEMGKPSPSVLQFLARRLLYSLASFILITLVLYGGIMLVPPEARAQLYIPKGKEGRLAVSENYVAVIIRDHHLDAPYFVQYGYWLAGLVEGTWGYSPTLQEDVLQALLRRTPVTLELGLYALLVALPLGLRAGVAAGWKPRRAFDRLFRGLAFFSLAMPPFILAMLLLAIFYAKLRWFPLGRLDVLMNMQLAQYNFHSYTGLLTIDSILNARPDVLFDALRHLVMPVFTLAIYHWATLGRIARAMTIDERRKEYLIAARAKGVSEHRLMWTHLLRSILAPSLTGMALSAASIVTGVYVVEVIFGLNGISNVIVVAMNSQPDAPAVLGFAVYSAILVIGLMLVLDVLQAVVDPRVRAETMKS